MGYRRVPLKVLDNYVPKEHTSPSTLGKFIRCPRMFGFEKLMGIREAEERPWLGLGKEVEYYQQKYLEGYAIPQDTEGGRRALSSLHLLPDPRECATIIHQEQIAIDTRLISPGIEPFEIRGAKDLIFSLGGAPHVWHLTDYKTTRGNTRKKGGEWDYCMSQQKLLDDIQGNWYAWDVFQNKGGTRLPARWVYTLTDVKKNPDARATDVVFELPRVLEMMQKFLDAADWHRDLARQFKRQPFDVNGLPANPEACDTFGGCPYRPANGGPCNQPSRTIGAMMQQMGTNGQPPTDLEMLLDERRKQGQQAGGAPQYAPPPGPGAPMPPPGYPPPPQSYAPPPAPMAPPPMQPPPPQAMAPQGPPGAPPPGTRQNGHVWTGQQWVVEQPGGSPVPVPAPPQAYAAPPAPHLPPEAYQPPQQPTSQPGGQPMLPPGAPQLPGMPPPAPAQTTGKRGRKAKQSPGAPAEPEDETDDRAMFMRAVCLALPGANAQAEIAQRAQVNVEYASYLWQLLQHAGA